ncbi:helix-turn-helix domain-containing protein [Bradyrhizobium sp. LLZ17]|uniref:Helix-turn-helix domain-containing protein n=1 Tax=Bradyrhizobium sp. LLZ17 TaxID=3239388 RepID=A0AB39XI69_9BRAD
MDPIVHTIPETCTRAKVGRTVVYEAIRSGALRAVKRGRRTLILDEDLRQWVHSFPPLEPKALVRRLDSNGAI